MVFTTPSNVPHKELSRLIEQTAEADAQSLFELISASFQSRYMRATPPELKAMITHPGKGKEPGTTPLNGYVVLDAGNAFSWNFLTDNLSMDTLFSLNSTNLGVPWCYQVESALSANADQGNYLLKVCPPGQSAGVLDPTVTIVVQRSTIEL
jgi:hypothetical protein